MAWKQILRPNLDDDPNNPLYIWQGGTILTDWYGWCLAVVAGSFGATGSSYSARTAWESCWSKHYDRDIPEHIWVPLWYGGGEYGHVVMGWRDKNWITVYSSPYTHKPSFEVFNGELNSILDSIGQIYGVGAYSGWSESVLDSRVIAWEAESQPTPTPTPEPNPEPTPEPDPEPSEPIDNNNGKDEDMSTPSEPTTEPSEHPSQQLAGGVIDKITEASDWFDFSPTLRLVMYLLADSLLVGGLVIPDIINAIQAPTPAVFAEYLSKVLIEVGTCILMIFKLIKKK